MFLIGRGSFPIQSKEMLTKDEIQKIADEVVKELGSDFEEKVYQEAFLAELRIRAYEYDRERTIPVLYKGQQIGIVKADVFARKESEEVILKLKVSPEDLKPNTKNELKAYLRAIEKSQPPRAGVKRTGFVVTFPCTSSSTKKDRRAKATVDEVTVSDEF